MESAILDDEDDMARELVPLGVEGAIIGTALYLGDLSLPEALTAAGVIQPLK
jgi:phosphoribosylformimino-5-aminoimidazole carboxamide ribonucleotide (ProFAR) isomerase